MPKQNEDLINETAKALLEAIKEDAPRRGPEGIEALARAYSLVVGSALNDTSKGIY